MPGFPTVRRRRAPITALALVLAVLPAGVAHAASPPVITKVSPMKVEIGQGPAGDASKHITADLTGTRLMLSEFGWTKGQGVPAKARSGSRRPVSRSWRRARSSKTRR